MTSPISSIHFGSSPTKFGSATSGAAQQQLLLQQEVQRIQEERQELKSKRAGTDALWHGSVIGAFTYGLVSIGSLGKKVAATVWPSTPPDNLLEGITKSLGITGTDTLLGSLASVAAPVSLLYGLYYFVNGRNKA